MSSLQLGTSTSEVEVSHISNHGIGLLVREREFFLPFDAFPWFENASIKDVLNVSEFRDGHFHWPGLDVDLTLDSIEHPERYPLIAKH